MTGVLVAIFGVMLLYLVISGIFFSRANEVSGDDLAKIPTASGDLLAEVRAFMQRHGISEDWLLRHGNEKEVWSCEPGSIFGRVTRRRQFGHPLPFSPLATASEDELKRILQRGPALLSFRNEAKRGRMLVYP